MPFILSTWDGPDRKDAVHGTAADLARACANTPGRTVRVAGLRGETLRPPTTWERRHARVFATPSAAEALSGTLQAHPLPPGLNSTFLRLGDRGPKSVRPLPPPKPAPPAASERNDPPFMRLATDLKLEVPVLDAIEADIGRLRSVEATVFLERSGLAGTPRTPGETARRLLTTQDRVRRFERDALARFEQSSGWPGALAGTLSAALPAALAEILAAPWAAGLDERSLLGLARLCAGRPVDCVVVRGVRYVVALSASSWAAARTDALLAMRSAPPGIGYEGAFHLARRPLGALAASHGWLLAEDVGFPCQDDPDWRQALAGTVTADMALSGLLRAARDGDPPEPRPADPGLAERLGRIAPASPEAGDIGTRADGARRAMTTAEAVDRALRQAGRPLCLAEVYQRASALLGTAPKPLAVRTVLKRHAKAGRGLYRPRG